MVREAAMCYAQLAEINAGAYACFFRCTATFQLLTPAEIVDPSGVEWKISVPKTRRRGFSNPLTGIHSRFNASSRSFSCEEVLIGCEQTCYKSQRYCVLSPWDHELHFASPLRWRLSFDWGQNCLALRMSTRSLLGCNPRSVGL